MTAPVSGPPIVSDVVIGLSGPRLSRAVDRALRGSSRLVVVTDERESLASLGARVTVVEFEELLPRGVSEIEEAWDSGLATWLQRIFPGRVSGFALGEMLWVNLLLQPELRVRIDAVALQEQFFRRFAPRRIDVVGPVPSLCATLFEEARCREIPVHGDLRARAKAAMRRPLDALLAGALLVRNGVRLAERIKERRRMLRRLDAVTTSDGKEDPKLWVILSPKWPQNSRHVIENLLPALDREHIPYGLAFSMTFGEQPVPAEGNFDELSLFDGTLGRFTPAALDQITGITDWSAAPRLLARSAMLSLASGLRIARLAGDLRVGGQVASLASDTRALLRVATHDVLRVVDAEQAGRRFIKAHPSARTVVFSFAAHAETVVVDKMMQRAGIATVDFAHGEANASNLRTHWRSHSVYHASWTRNESRSFARMGTNPHCVGGYMPRLRVAPKGRCERPRLLVATNYLCECFRLDGRISTGKFARRLAAAIVQLVEHLGDRAEVILRPHPLEDRAAWRELLGTCYAPAMSEVRSLSDDLARSTLVVTTLGSAAIEAVAASVPVVFHRGPPVEPGSLFGLISEERWFSTGEELIDRIDTLLAGPPDLSPERRLLDACFGAELRPRPMISLVLEVDPALVAQIPSAARRPTRG